MVQSPPPAPIRRITKMRPALPAAEGIVSATLAAPVTLQNTV